MGLSPAVVIADGRRGRDSVAEQGAEILGQARRDGKGRIHRAIIARTEGQPAIRP
jgi:hypothetical protein